MCHTLSDDEGTPADDPNNPQSTEGGSVFSRLEETRTLLEGKFGLDTLVEAYQLVQVCVCMCVCVCVCVRAPTCTCTLLYG